MNHVRHLQEDISQLISPFKQSKNQSIKSSSISPVKRSEAKKVEIARFMNKIKEDLGESSIKLKLNKKLKTKSKELNDNAYKPLVYKDFEGKDHHVNTLEELRELIKIESFETVVQGIVRKNRIKENT